MDPQPITLTGRYVRLEHMTLQHAPEMYSITDDEWPAVISRLETKMRDWDSSLSEKGD